VEPIDYLVSPGLASACFCPQPYFRWNFSTRPAVSTNLTLPVKNGWQAEQISTWILGRVLRVLKEFPQPQTTVVSP